MTNDNVARVWKQRQGNNLRSFTSRYNVTIPIFCESFPDALSAIAAEKQIKGWTRAKKVALIESVNPDWRDLSEDPIRG